MSDGLYLVAGVQKYHDVTDFSHQPRVRNPVFLSSKKEQKILISYNEVMEKLKIVTQYKSLIKFFANNKNQMFEYDFCLPAVPGILNLIKH